MIPINTPRKHKSLRALLWLLLVMAATLAGCTRNPGKDNDDQPGSGETKLVEDDQLYMLLNCNPDTDKLFLENVDTGKQEKFDFDEETKAVNRSGESAAVDSLPVGELVEISYTEEKLLKKVAVPADTFEYKDVTDYEIDPEAATITVDGASYSYDEYLKIFSNKGGIPLNVLLEREEGDTVCIRGRGAKALTVMLDRKETEGTDFLKWFQNEEESD